MSIRFLGRCLFGSKVRAYSCLLLLDLEERRMMLLELELELEFIVSTGEAGSVVVV